MSGPDIQPIVKGKEAEFIEIKCICFRQFISFGSVYYLILLEKAEKPCCIDCYDIRDPFFDRCQNNITIEVFR